jgi:hypothetical protein
MLVRRNHTEANPPQNLLQRPLPKPSTIFLAFFAGAVFFTCAPFWAARFSAHRFLRQQ